MLDSACQLASCSCFRSIDRMSIRSIGSSKRRGFVAVEHDRRLRILTAAKASQALRYRGGIMIIRVFRPRVHPAKEDEFEHFVVGQACPW